MHTVIGITIWTVMQFLRCVAYTFQGVEQKHYINHLEIASIFKPYFQRLKVIGQLISMQFHSQLLPIASLFHGKLSR